MSDILNSLMTLWMVVLHTGCRRKVAELQMYNQPKRDFYFQAVPVINKMNNKSRILTLTKRVFKLCTIGGSIRN